MFVKEVVKVDFGVNKYVFLAKGVTVYVYKRFIRELVTYFHTGLPVGDKL